jgi:hypothetical protein
MDRGGTGICIVHELLKECVADIQGVPMGQQLMIVMAFQRKGG